MKLQRKIAEESLEASEEARERALQKIRETAGALAELRMAAELGEEWIDVLLDDEEPLPADLLLAIRAALQGPARGVAAGTPKGFQDAVDITIPRRVKTEDINRYMELAFRDTFEPLRALAEGKVHLQCARKTADAVRKEVIIRGEEIKAHVKKKRDADNNDEEEPSDDDDNGGNRCSAGKSDGRAGRSGKAGAKMWFVGCYGCGGDHRWTACHAVGPIGQKERCTRCGKKGHIAKVCTQAASARAAFLSNYGKPWEFEAAGRR